MSSNQFLILESETVIMLEKIVMEEVQNQSSPGFYSRNFLVLKKGNKSWCPVINLSCLKKFIDVNTLKVESEATILPALQESNCSASKDLKDAIGILNSHQKYQRFTFKNKVYLFKVLRFGLASNPAFFCRVVSAIVRYCHIQRIQLHAYMDDWLLQLPNVSSTFELLTCVHAKREVTIVAFTTDHIVRVPCRPGGKEGVLNPRKYSEPDLYNQDSFKKIAHLSTTAEKLIGLVNAGSRVIPLNRLHLRKCQLLMPRLWDRSLNNIDLNIPITTEMKDVFSAWLNKDWLRQGVPQKPSIVSKTISTDKSTYG